MKTDSPCGSDATTCHTRQHCTRSPIPRQGWTGPVIPSRLRNRAPRSGAAPSAESPPGSPGGWGGRGSGAAGRGALSARPTRQAHSPASSASTPGPAARRPHGGGGHSERHGNHLNGLFPLRPLHLAARPHPDCPSRACCSCARPEALGTRGHQGPRATPRALSDSGHSGAFQTHLR